MEEFWYILLVSIFISVGCFLMLSSTLIRVALGLNVFSNGINLLIFVSGRLDSFIPPFIDGVDQDFGLKIANSLPQALILTAIVIGFALFTTVLALSYAIFVSSKIDNTNVLHQDHNIKTTSGSVAIY